MSLYVGGTKINRVLVNGSDVNKLYVGGTKVWANNIEFIGSASASITTSTSSSVNVSGIDIQANDLIICTKGAGYHTTGTLPSTPSGFTNIFNRWGGGSSTNTSVNASYKYAVGGETSITVGSCGVQAGGAVIMVFRNVALSNPLDVPVTGLTGNSYTNNVNPLAITTISPDAVVVACGSAFTWSAGRTFTSPDMSNITYATGVSTYGAVVGMAWKSISTPSSFNPASWSCSSTDAPTHMTCTIALKPRY